MHFPKNGVVVDVGCGIGNVALELSKIRHDLMFVLEDRPQFIEYARRKDAKGASPAANTSRDVANFDSFFVNPFDIDSGSH